MVPLPLRGRDVSGRLITLLSVVFRRRGEKSKGGESTVHLLAGKYVNNLLNVLVPFMYEDE